MHTIIKKIIKKQGQDVITSKILVNCIDDEGGFSDVEKRPYKKILKLIIEEDYSRKLLEIGAWNAETEMLARTCAQRSLIQEEGVLYVFACLAYGLGWLSKAPKVPAEVKKIKQQEAKKEAEENEAARKKAETESRQKEEAARKKAEIAEKRALEAERRAKDAERKAKEAEAARVKAEAIAQEKAAVETRKKKIKQIVVAVAVLLVCVSLIIYLMNNPSANTTSPTPNPKVKEKTVEVPVEKVVEKPKVERKTQAPKANNNDIKLDYGVWESSKSPNKINGRGKLTYTKSAPIKGWPGKVAQPGDYVEGRFENGKPVNANWYDKNGNKKDYLGGSSE